MSGRISAKTIFNFTNRYNSVINTLKYGFAPRFCIEKNIYGDYMPIPMVCFCDIPLSLIEHHSSRYGDYAIGLSKKWALKVGINPVMYVVEHSHVINNIKMTIDKGKSLKDRLLYNSFFLKPYEEDHNFYDEREWRYIPEYNYLKKINLNPSQLIEQSNSIEGKKLDKFNLKFCPSDIQYIILKTENEILNLVDFILSDELNYSLNTKKKLITKIISMERIKQDF